MPSTPTVPSTPTMPSSGPTTGPTTAAPDAPSTDDVREQVRKRYASAAADVARSEADTDSAARPGAVSDPDACCSCDCGPTGTAQAVEVSFGGARYEEWDRQAVPTAALAASLGCGNPTAVAELAAGETVLDLGSGGGIDVILSARRVGPDGRVFGLDMTDEMIDLARRNAARAEVANVEFLLGDIEDIPLPDGSVDVVISNCVINLSTDKPRVFGEIARVLRPGGRLGISDVVAEDRLTEQERRQRGDWAGCIAGALSVTEYRAGLAAAGLAEVSVEPTHEVADGLHGSIVRAVKPTTPIG